MHGGELAGESVDVGEGAVAVGCGDDVLEAGVSVPWQGSYLVL